MKVYDFNSILSFGKYSGQSIRSISQSNPSYIDWCSINLDHFLLEEETMRQIEETAQGFKFSTQAIEVIDVKWKEFDDYDEDLDSGYSHEYHREPETYNEYNGTYAQDVEGLSDQFINDVLDGQPDAYWNID